MLAIFGKNPARDKWFLNSRGSYVLPTQHDKHATGIPVVKLYRPSSNICQKTFSFKRWEIRDGLLYQVKMPPPTEFK